MHVIAANGTHGLSFVAIIVGVVVVVVAIIVVVVVVISGRNYC